MRYSHIFVLIGCFLSISATAQQANNPASSQLNVTTRSFLDRLRQDLTNVTEERDAEPVYDRIFDRNGYATGVFKKLRCRRLEGPDDLRRIGAAM